MATCLDDNGSFFSGYEKSKFMGLLKKYDTESLKIDLQVINKTNQDAKETLRLQFYANNLNDNDLNFFQIYGVNENEIRGFHDKIEEIVLSCPKRNKIIRSKPTELFVQLCAVALMVAGSIYLATVTEKKVSLENSAV